MSQHLGSSSRAGVRTRKQVMRIGMTLVLLLTVLWVVRGVMKRNVSQAHADSPGTTSKQTKPKQVPMEQYEALQQELETANRNHERDQKQVADLQKRLTQANAQLARSITIDQLPESVRASNASQTISNIRSRCDQTTGIQPETFTSLFNLLAELQDNGVIHTGYVVDTPKRADLYRDIQQCLKAIDAYQGLVNGDQKTTESAVKAFQTQRGLAVDGKIGMKTFQSMIETLQSRLTRPPVSQAPRHQPVSSPLDTRSSPRTVLSLQTITHAERNGAESDRSDEDDDTPREQYSESKH